MKHSSRKKGNEAKILSESVRAVRLRYGKSAKELAAQLGWALRTYQGFEQGRGELRYDRIFAFASATKSDGFALLLGVILGLPTLAIDCVETKLCQIMIQKLQQFVEEHGRDISHLDPRYVTGGFDRLYKDLGTKMAEYTNFDNTWFSDRWGIS